MSRTARAPFLLVQALYSGHLDQCTHIQHPSAQVQLATISRAERSMLRSARDMVASCTCAEGCWMCVHWSKCPEYNACTSKKGALAVLDILLSAPPPHAQNPCATPPTETPDDTLETAQPNPCATATRDEESSMLGKSVAIFRRLAHANQRRVLERMGANPTT